MKTKATLFFIITSCFTYAQNAGINDTGGAPNASAGFDIDFTNKGLLIPRVALVAANNNSPIGASIVTSLLVYNTATAGVSPNSVAAGYYYWNGTQWIRLLNSGSTTGSGWQLAGNAATTAGTHFLGTTDATDFVTKTNDMERMRVLSNGNVGIGNTSPAHKFQVDALGATNYAVYATNTGSCNGVYANASGTGVGVNGTSNSNYGVSGQSQDTYGVYGKTESATSGGVCGFDQANVIYGILGHANLYSLNGNGSMAVSGTKSFNIDHPLDPENKFLRYYSIESNEVLNKYSGIITTNANGDATVTLPDYAMAITTNFRYQLTVIGAFTQVIIKEEINNNGVFKIKTQLPNIKVSWELTGNRNDKWVQEHGAEVEVLKKGNEKGKYLNPELWGQTKSKSIVNTSEKHFEDKTESVK